VNAAFTQLQGVLQNFRKCSGCPGRDAGIPPTAWTVFVVLVMRKSSYEARAALIPGGLITMKPRA
jgi:hypothetical protein